MTSADINLVVFDGDETLVDGDVIEELARRADARDSLAAIHDRVWQGELTAMTALKERIVPLFEGLPRTEVEDAVAACSLSPGAAEVGRKITCETAVITSINPHAKRIAERIGADYAIANELIDKDGMLTGEIRGTGVESGKGAALAELIGEVGSASSGVIVVGDGPQDIPMFEVADFSVGVAPKPAVEGIPDVSVDDRDIRQVEPYLAEKGVIEDQNHTA